MLSHSCHMWWPERHKSTFVFVFYGVTSPTRRAAAEQRCAQNQSQQRWRHRANNRWFYFQGCGMPWFRFATTKYAVAVVIKHLKHFGTLRISLRNHTANYFLGQIRGDSCGAVIATQIDLWPAAALVTSAAATAGAHGLLYQESSLVRKAVLARKRWERG